MIEGQRLSDIMKENPYDEENNQRSNQISTKKNKNKINNSSFRESSPNNPSVLISKTPLNRVNILEALSYHILLIDRRISGERFREQDGDKTRISYFRALAYAIAIYGTLLKDAELEELEKRIAALESVKNVNEGNRR